MKITRDILGTEVTIELTEEEITKAHIAYLEQEMKTLKNSALTTNMRARKTESIMPRADECCENEADYMIKLRECDKRLRKIGKKNPVMRHAVLKEYDDYIVKAMCNGLTYDNLQAILGVSKSSLSRHMSVYRDRNITHVA